MAATHGTHDLGLVIGGGERINPAAARSVLECTEAVPTSNQVKLFRNSLVLVWFSECLQMRRIVLAN